MNLQYRIELLARLGDYILKNEGNWQEAKDRASRENGWFTPEFIDIATVQIATNFLPKPKLEQWVAPYQFPPDNKNQKTIGIVMAGNIPLVGFHDMLCVFISGHRSLLKLSSRDSVLLKHIIAVMGEWAAADGHQLPITISDLLKGCDAYIATGSNNTATHFEYYFRNQPHIIRRNRTSAALLTGAESTEELSKLADDVYQYFGLGCRNVTKIYVPEGYDFVPLLETFRKYHHLSDHHKYRNNFDYNLALHILNKKYYMSNESLLVVEDPSLFSPISQLNYEYYTDREKTVATLLDNPDLQCLVGNGHVPFGSAQLPQLNDYADGVDTLQFLRDLG